MKLTFMGIEMLTIMSSPQLFVVHNNNISYYLLHIYTLIHFIL